MLLKSWATVSYYSNSSKTTRQWALEGTFFVKAEAYTNVRMCKVLKDSEIIDAWGTDRIYLTFAELISILTCCCAYTEMLGHIANNLMLSPSVQGAIKHGVLYISKKLK